VCGFFSAIHFAGRERLLMFGMIPEKFTATRTATMEGKKNGKPYFARLPAGVWRSRQDYPCLILKHFLFYFKQIRLFLLNFAFSNIQNILF
jgi:hypothetical protein